MFTVSLMDRLSSFSGTSTVSLMRRGIKALGLVVAFIAHAPVGLLYGSGLTFVASKRGGTFTSLAITLVND